MPYITFTIFPPYSTLSLLQLSYHIKEPSLTVTEGAGVVEFNATRTGAVGQADCIGVTVVDITTQVRSPLFTQYTQLHIHKISGCAA